MEKLMKPAEYAKELGISRQAVYAKVKRGILPTKDVEGKLYIVVDNDQKAQASQSAQTVQETKPKITQPVSAVSTEVKDYKKLLQAKDETIAVLKGTVKDLKKSNKQISTTLRGEIDLLKEAFYEMRTLYALQLEQKKPQDTIEVFTDIQEEETLIGLKKFFKQQNIQDEEQQEKVTKRFKKAYKNGDPRMVKIDGKLKLYPSRNYGDLLH
jgi:predicted DNA-binding protein YlxM (UPF0122 family)